MFGPLIRTAPPRRGGGDSGLPPGRANTYKNICRACGRFCHGPAVHRLADGPSPDPGADGGRPSVVAAPCG